MTTVRKLLDIEKISMYTYKYMHIKVKKKKETNMCKYVLFTVYLEISVGNKKKKQLENRFFCQHSKYASLNSTLSYTLLSAKII